MRTLVQFDGQNLFHLAQYCWGPAPPYHYASYHVEKLAQALVAMTSGRTLKESRFYTGVPDHTSRPTLNKFWTNKLRHLRNQGIHVYRGRINAGGQEKGVDVSLALDLIQATYEQRYDVAIIVSQDSDFGPAVRLAKEIARDQGRTLGFESASRSNRGVCLREESREPRGSGSTKPPTTLAMTRRTTEDVHEEAVNDLSSLRDSLSHKPKAHGMMKE